MDTGNVSQSVGSKHGENKKSFQVLKIVSHSSQSYLHSMHWPILTVVEGVDVDNTYVEVS